VFVLRSEPPGFPREAGCPGSSDPPGRSVGPAHFRSDLSDGTPRSSGDAEVRSLVKTSRESVGSARSRSTRSRGKALERRTPDLPEGGRKKRRKERFGKPNPRRAGNALERQKSP
jgi:hypothetical protein